MKNIKKVVLSLIFVIVLITVIGASIFFIKKRNNSQKISNVAAIKVICEEKYKSAATKSSFLDLFIPKANATYADPFRYGIRFNFDKDTSPESYVVNIGIIGDESDSSYLYEVSSEVTTDHNGVLYFYPPPSHYETQITVCAKTNRGDTNYAVFSAKDFSNAIGQSSSENPELGNVSLTVGSKDEVNVNFKTN